MEIHIDNNTLKELENGIHRNEYLIYNRKSTDEPDNQKNSIAYQKTENIAYAQKHGLLVANFTVRGFCTDGIISEKHSGFKANENLVFSSHGTVQYEVERPKFYKLAEFLYKGYFKGVIILSWDRASRNKGDNTIIEKLINKGVDIHFALTQYAKSSAGALHMDIDGMFAIYHSRNTSEKIKLAMNKKRDEGICTFRAPVGYLNLGQMENKPFDKKRAPIIKQLFELYATGEWSLASLARWANAQGLTMPPVRRKRSKEELLLDEDDVSNEKIKPIARPLTYNNIHKILHNRFYTGKILNNESLYIPSKSHKALVSEKLFNDVQKQLGKHRVSVKYGKTINHPYRGLIRCSSCKRVYTPYEQKGHIYYGSRCLKECDNSLRNLNKTLLEDTLSKGLQSFLFSDEELIELEKRITTSTEQFEQERIEAIQSMENRKNTLKEELQYLKDNKVSLLQSGVYAPDTLIKEEEKRKHFITRLELHQEYYGLSVSDIVQGVKSISEHMKTLYQYHILAKTDEKDRIVRTLFSELYFSDKGLQTKDGFQLSFFKNTSLVLGDPKLWYSEASRSHKFNIRLMERIRMLLPKYIDDF